jgi:gluconate 2-dehydrogenase gamma chain
MSDSTACFNDNRRTTLAAAAARVLPSDDGPGAAETGVAGYLEAALGEPELRGLRPIFEQGLDLLDTLAREHCGTAFAAGSPGDQDEVLHRLSQLEELPPRIFFERLIALSLEGFLCDPSRGGNREGLGWRSIGFERRPAGAPASKTAPASDTGQP